MFSLFLLQLRRWKWLIRNMRTSVTEGTDGFQLNQNWMDIEKTLRHRHKQKWTQRCVYIYIYIYYKFNGSKLHASVLSSFSTYVSSAFCLSFIRCNILKMLRWPRWGWKKKQHFIKNLTSWSTIWKRLMKWRRRHWWTGRKTPMIGYKSNNRCGIDNVMCTLFISPSLANDECFSWNEIMVSFHLSYNFHLLKAYYFFSPFLLISYFVRLKKKMCTCKDNRSWKKLKPYGTEKMSWGWERRLLRSENFLIPSECY